MSNIENPIAEGFSSEGSEIGDIFSSGQERITDTQILMALLDKKYLDFITEVDYPYELALLGTIRDICFWYDKATFSILTSVIRHYKTEKIPFKRKRVDEILKAFQNLRENQLKQDRRSYGDVFLGDLNSRRNR